MNNDFFFCNYIKRFHNCNAKMKTLENIGTKFDG